MTLVTKTVKGISYYYFQDSVPADGGTQVITTFVCRADEPENRAMIAKMDASMKHMYKMLLAAKAIQTYNSTQLNEIDLIGMDFISLMNKQLRHNIQPNELEEIEKTFYNRYVYGTTAIEGITLDEDEAAKVLQTGLTPANKPVPDTIAVANFKDARAFLDSYSGDVTKKLTKDVHSILMYGMKTENSRPVRRGLYRDNKVLIHGLGYTPPAPELIPQSMKYLVAEYDDGKKQNTHPVELAVIFHQKFEEIHPFQDGNGRVGREILNFMLTKGGLPPIYITPSERTLYINALEAGNRGDHIPLIEFIISRIKATMVFYITRTSMAPAFYSQYNSPDFEKFAKENGLESLKEMIFAAMKELKEASGLP